MAAGVEEGDRVLLALEGIVHFGLCLILMATHGQSVSGLQVLV